MGLKQTGGADRGCGEKLPSVRGRSFLAGAGAVRAVPGHDLYMDLIFTLSHLYA